MATDNRVALSDLAIGGRRTKTHNATIVFKLPQTAKDLTKRVAEDQGVSDATIIREALAEYFERRGYTK